MAILNPDGSQYQVTSGIQAFDPENPEFDLFNSLDQEALNIGGAPVYYYEVLIQMQSVDQLYLEDRGKLWNPNPICFMSMYDPVPSQNQMTMFGMDSPDEILFEFNYQDVLKKVGHPLRIGSRLYSAHRRENWVIIQDNAESFQLWGQLRLQVVAKRFQESLTTGEGKISQLKKTPDFKIDASNRI